MRVRPRPQRAWRPRAETLEARIALSTYYVALNGNDSASGSSSQPWQTLQHAADVVTAGDTVDVRVGIMTLAQWQSQTGQDAHSFVSTAAALFVNPSQNDYQLSATSPAIDAGTSMRAPKIDILGNPRPKGKGWDICCYEYQGN
jgi:hypothetical protein